MSVQVVQDNNKGGFFSNFLPQALSMAGAAIGGPAGMAALGSGLGSAAGTAINGGNMGDILSSGLIGGLGYGKGNGSNPAGGLFSSLGNGLKLNMSPVDPYDQQARNFMLQPTTNWGSRRNY